MAKRKRVKSPPDHARVLDTIKQGRRPKVFRLRLTWMAAILLMILVPAFVLAVGFWAKPQWWVLALAAFVAEFALVTAYRNTRLVADDYGLRYYDLYGRLIFSSDWSQLREFSYCLDSESEPIRLRITSANGACATSNLGGCQDIKALIRERAPQAKIEVVRG